MNERFYYNGTQIKNYLVGFASLFSEIPYADRNGKIKTVPIHYGSQSDVISFLESNVDTDETKNRNRLKDISIPLLSFRLTGLEHNIEKRRAPLDSKTVDLRPMGYSTGYVTMMPTPYKFTMELVCWASSDYQAFEITEQIIPYFNSPQQVTIEPLPRSPVSKTEIFLESVEIDTDPESQKYSATITMTFTLTGWMFAQPRIWSTNLKFELSVLDSSTKDNFNSKSNDYSFDKKIVDLNSVSNTMDKNSIKTIQDFINSNPKINKIYNRNYYIYNKLIDNKKIVDDNIIDTTPLNINILQEELTINEQYMQNIIESIKDLKFIFQNKILMDIMQKHTIESNLLGFKKIFNETTDLLLIYLKLLENKMATTEFIKTDILLTNTEKLNIFGSLKLDFDEILIRLQRYLAILENIILDKPSHSNSTILGYKLRDIPKFIISTLAVNNTDVKIFEVINKHFGLTYNDILTHNDILVTFITSIKPETPGIPTQVENTIIQQPIYDDVGKLVFDSNNDGYINNIDIINLGSIFDINTNLKLIDNIWYKNTASIEQLELFGFYLKTLIYYNEKIEYDEIKDYLILENAGYIVSSADMYPLEQYEYVNKLVSMGYDISELEDNLLFIRLLNRTLEMLLVDLKQILISKVKNSENLAYLENNLDVNKLTLGLYLNWYSKKIITISDKNEMDLLIETDEYINYAKPFMKVYDELFLTGELHKVLKYENKWIEQKISNIKTLVADKYI